MLLLDVGNSRCKWALVQNGQWTHRGVLANSELVALQQEFAKLPPPTEILVSNVAGDAMAERLCTICAMWDCQPTFVTARASQCGVSNRYQHVQRLGSDRWAALIAAWWRARGACLVVNCGTATTVDALSDQGEFIGGLIFPGIFLMQQSLWNNTEQLNNEAGILCEFPLNTADAIHSGVLRASLGAIEQQYSRLSRRYPNARCLLSGGDADKVMPHLALHADYLDNLVLHGLQIIGEEKI